MFDKYIDRVKSTIGLETWQCSKSPRSKEDGMGKAIILDKTKGNWSSGEVSALTEACGEVETLRSKPERVVVATREPFGGETLQQVLGHSDFTIKEVDYHSRWA
jgi:hypothetical protein